MVQITRVVLRGIWVGFRRTVNVGRLRDDASLETGFCVVRLVAVLIAPSFRS